MEDPVESPEGSASEKLDSSLLSSWSSQESLDSNPSFSEDFISYRNSVKMFVQNSVVNSMTLKTRFDFWEDGISETAEIASILQLFVDSEISELKLKGCHVYGKLKAFCKELVKTNIKRLVLQTDLFESDLLYLTRALKDSKITHLDISCTEIELDASSAKRILPPMIESHITALDLSYCELQKGGDKILAATLPNTTIVHLNVNHCRFFYDGLMALFSVLPSTKITELNLECILFATFHPVCVPGCAMRRYNFKQIGEDEGLCQELYNGLKFSNVLKLNLSDCKLDGWCLTVLFCEWLEESNIVDLNLANNCFDDVDLIFKEENIRTRKTKITSLNISGNKVYNTWEADLINFFSSSVSTLNFSGCGFDDFYGQDLFQQLKSLEVTNLDLAKNELGLESLREFASIVNDVKVEAVNFANNNLSAEALAVLGDCLKDSSLKELDISDNFKQPLNATDAVALATLIEKTKGSKIECLKMSSNALSWNGTELIAVSLMNTTLTHLDLSSNQIGSAVKLLAGHLKSSAITHLNLSNNGIDYEGAEALAKCLKETKIINLNLSKNCIHFHGALAIAMCAKDTSLLYLKLNYCSIFFSDEECKDLIEHIDSTFLMKFSLQKYYVRTRIDEVMWKNKASVGKLIKFFKLEIMPFLENKKFPFNQNIDVVNFDTFFEKWLKFYQTIFTRPAAMVVLGQDESIPFSREQIAELFLEEFPHQLTQFIASLIDVDVLELVRFLKNVEEMGLSQIVELLLLHRPIFMIDVDLNILHPYVYTLLYKYKRPICHFDTEPQKLINYFTGNVDLEGASDVIEILSNKK